MQFKTLSVASLAASLAAAADHSVFVGQSGLTFTPNSVNASQGDTVTFHFYPKNHNVVQAAFASPCEPLSKGFYSGFHSTASGEANTTFRITINDTKPIWFYCSQASHCQGGMVGVINQAATGANTIAAFTTAAKNATNNTTPEGVVAGTGGVLASSTSTNSSSGNANAAASLGSSSLVTSSMFALLVAASFYL